MEPELTFALFAEHQGSTFAVDGGTLGTIFLVLEQVRSLGPGSGRAEAFSLEFVGPVEPMLEQQILPLEHAEMGRLDVFVVPLGPDADGAIRYEAVFT